MSATPLRAAVVGLREPGLQHAACVAGLPEEFRFVGGCDPAADARAAFQSRFPGVAVYSAFGDMLAQAAPEIVVLATGAAPRCALTLQAVEAGVRGIFAEKPIAVGMGEARRMVDACNERGVPLVVNHQRRTLPVFRTMRRLISEGALGEVHLIRASCAGDVLSDGTHLVNTVNFLLGEPRARWVSGMINLHPQEPLKAWEQFNGRRYGHAVEYGAFAFVEYENGCRAEFHMGSLQIARGQYQRYEVYGSRGRLLRTSDQGEPELLMASGESETWREVPLDLPPGYHRPTSLALPWNYEVFAQLVRGEKTGHPLHASSALQTHEIVMAIYESARLHERINLPLAQERFPLELMLEAAEK